MPRAKRPPLPLLLIFLLALLAGPACGLLDELPTPTPLPAPTSLPDGASCVPARGERSTATVTRIMDGDTIQVEIDGESYRVRYIGIDTPESTREVEPFGPEASQRNAELVEGQTVTLVKDVSETDRYDRLLRYVFVGDLFVNYELVSQGYATAVTFPPDVACEDTFRAAEREAREADLGLWGLP